MKFLKRFFSIRKDFKKPYLCDTCVTWFKKENLKGECVEWIKITGKIDLEILAHKAALN